MMTLEEVVRAAERSLRESGAGPEVKIQINFCGGSVDLNADQFKRALDNFDRKTGCAATTKKQNGGST